MKVEISHLNKTIKGNQVLKDISFTFDSSVLYGLRGHNGSGKSMLMRAIAGLIKPSSGTIKIDDKLLGKDISFPPSVGVLIEEPAFINELTGFENLKMLAQIKGIISDSQIREAIAEMGLNPDDKRSFKKYSLGMRQRLGIACALMENPDIILLDEPLNGLDPEGVDLALAAIRKRFNSGSLVIMSLHDDDELNAFATEVITMRYGEVVK